MMMVAVVSRANGASQGVSRFIDDLRCEFEEQAAADDVAGRRRVE